MDHGGEGVWHNLFLCRRTAHICAKTNAPYYMKLLQIGRLDHIGENAKNLPFRVHSRAYYGVNTQALSRKHRSV